MDSVGLTPDELAKHLPEAIALRSSRDGELARALSPTVQNAIGESARRDPKELATAIAPAIGPSIRQAVVDVLSRNRSRLAWFILVPVILLVVAAVLLVRSNQRWSRAIETLEQAPGIVVTSADRGWNRLRLTGLRDPLAADPSSLLAARGLDTSAIEAQWESYVSTQPPLVLERARRLLAAPAGVALAMSGDTLVVRGEAARRWRERAPAIASTLPGVSHVDLSGVADGVPGELDSLTRQAQEIRVLFPPGSDSLDARGRAAADSLAAQLIRLSAAAVHEGYGVSVVLVGRADSLGAATTRLALSSRRAEAVRAALVAAGIPSTDIAVEAIGSTDPVPVEEGETRALVNRSVSVVVNVSDAQSERSP